MTGPAGRTSSRGGKLGKSFVLLDLVIRQTSGVGVREAERATGIDRSAVSRIMAELEREGLVVQDPERAVYLPGPKLFSYAAALTSRDSLAQASKVFLQELTNRIKETTYLAALTGDVFDIRAKCDGPNRLSYVFSTGEIYPVPYGAGGMAILSALPPDEARMYIDEHYTPVNDLSFKDTDEYMAELESDRRRGYSVSFGRWERDGAGVASPVFGPSCEVLGSVVAIGPVYRFLRVDIQKMGLAVRETAHKLSRRMGFYGSWEGWES